LPREQHDGGPLVEAVSETMGPSKVELESARAQSRPRTRRVAVRTTCVARDTRMTELLYRSASEAVELVRSRQVSSRELTEAVLARIKAVDPSLNAVVELRAEAALEEAGAADVALGRGQGGPLHGVPVTIKEAFDVAGLHTTWGNPAFAGYVADTDATVVARLKHAGAIVLGKTNVHAMLADFG
jgi:amidase